MFEIDKGKILKIGTSENIKATNSLMKKRKYVRKRKGEKLNKRVVVAK